MSGSKTICKLIVVLLVSAQFAISQVGDDVKGNGPPSTVSEKLKENHIALNRTALLQALHNPDAEIRGLAAVQLGGNKDISVVQDIIEAASVESRVPTRLDMALALTWLGEPKGAELLKTTCQNSQIAASLRTRAAAYLLDANDNGCLKAVLSIVQSEPESLSRMDAVALLPRFKNVSQDDSHKIHDSVVKSLKDDSPALRLTASHALVYLGDTSAIPDLQAAIAAEQDETIRNGLETDLKRLREK